ncbi:hypothetical protein BU15DRAFT_90630 [Melanogaster broomeanus]|nr:hypothetical protein BU15DRAFT_90630 [Melanogaster broomeanus]
MNSRFTCTNKCGRSFMEPRGLSRHRDVCPFWWQHSASPEHSTNITWEASSGPADSSRHSAQPTARTQTQAQSHSSATDSPSSLAAPTTGVIQDTNVPDPVLAPRAHRLPARFREQLPEPPSPVTLAEPPSRTRRVILHVFDYIQTKFNEFRISRSYRHRPSYDPDHFLTTNQLSNIVNRQATGNSRCDRSPPWPWPNMSIWRLMTWKQSGSSQKSDAEVTRLVTDVLNAPDFKLEDLSDFSASKEVKRLDTALETGSSSFFQKDGWNECSVQILVPTREKNPGGNGQPFYVPKFMHRSITSVIQAAFSESTSKWFHLMPFKRIWRSPVTGKTQRVYDELYCSDAWNTAHDELQKAKRDDGCQLERVIAGLMFWSDATQLAQFGQAKAWPIYLFFCSGACHPIAFIPTNGVVITCYDGVKRRVFPRIFTYSADYPEKAILATIRDKGQCPCPRCLIPASRFDRLGFDISSRLNHVRTYLQSKVAAARHAIYKLGSLIKGIAVEWLLKDFSMVPTVNAFIDRLSPLGFNLFPTLVVDLLHEFELGILKSVLIHLIRILFSIDPEKVWILNERFSNISPFGANDIRRFPDNVGDMKHRVARHFEDVLQCSLPAFEGLFPAEHDDTIRILLFRLAEWHALAKLRLHTDDSLELLDRALKALSVQLRKFQRVTCTAFQTKELPSEVAARRRRQRPGQTSDPDARPRIFNLLTYKIHALGDYVGTIKMFGTTDSYSTQIGELAHRLIKKFYGSTNKKNVSTQLAKQERRHTHTRRQRGVQGPSESDGLPTESHHAMSHSMANTINLANLVVEHQDNPATKDFTFKLRDHLLTRLYGQEYNGDEQHFSDAEHNNLELEDVDRVIVSKRLRVCYTTYDIRRDQDSMSPARGCTVMTLFREDDVEAHPFWYARVLRVFQISVRHVGPDSKDPSPRTMEVLWVRWLGVEPDYQWGFKEARLPKVGFVPDTDEDAFGFLDPTLVVRGCQLIPAFAEGPGSSLGRLPEETDDWASFYVNIFADRDMFARFAGIGVGHIAQFNKSMVSDIYDDTEINSDDSEEQNSGANEAIRGQSDEGFDDADSSMEDVYMSDLAEEDEDETMLRSDSESGDDELDSDGEDLGFTF